jgi:hypothetical protein
METKKRRFTFKETEAKDLVEYLTLKNNGVVPTYEELAENLGISKTSAYMRMKKNREMMRQKN